MKTKQNEDLKLKFEIQTLNIKKLMMKIVESIKIWLKEGIKF